MREVQLGVGFIKGPLGAPCTRILKKEQRKAFQRPGDIHVFGLHLGEEHRVDQLFDGEPGINAWFPLIEREMTKDDCHQMVMAAGIEIPAMYKLGYSNNNCIGCVKGAMGYWNKIRDDFPEVFAENAKLERQIGHSICKDEYRDENGKRVTFPVYLDELEPGRGNYKSEPPIKCGIICEGAN